MWLGGRRHHWTGGPGARMWGQTQDLSLFGKGEIRATSQWRLPSQQGAAQLQDAGVALQRVLSPSLFGDGVALFLN